MSKQKPTDGTLGYRSWGRLKKSKSSEVRLFWPEFDFRNSDGRSVLPYGVGRSYGDSCENEGKTLLCCAGLKRFVAFDSVGGVLRAEAGVTLDKALRLIVPKGWFLPTTPGTKFVTLGGAVANDVHGKNHHRGGSIGEHVTQFELLRSNGEKILCSRDKNPDWFAATIGGLGLTGLITWVELKLRPIVSSAIEVETIKTRHFDEFLEISKESDKTFEHTVCWIDCLAPRQNLGRGLFMRGNHSSEKSHGLRVHGDPRVSVPVSMPFNPLSKPVLKGFNTVYYNKQRARSVKAIQTYDTFFYPLDGVGNWNRMYGKAGFFQYQFVIPFAGCREPMLEILGKISESGVGSFLGVLKVFGDKENRGMLSFPREGVTLALDFPNKGATTLELFNQLDQIVVAAGGRLYPAKDARMSRELFQKGYPALNKFEKFKDPKFSSSFWRRVTG
jgi:FAD/FMN-containing dehydrogenase